MKVVELRNKVNEFLYKNIVRPVFFTQDPERMHNLFIRIGKILGSNIITKRIVRYLYYYEDKRLEQNILGMKFRNPVGLAVGFDKNAEMMSIMEDVGFGFVEVGSITAKGCGGNKGIRLKRLVREKSIWVNFGLNNKGADEIYGRIGNKRCGIPVGVSAAKTNCKETVDCEIGLKDYIYTLKKFRDFASFFVLNLSCPNAYGGEQFSNPKLYEKLMKEIVKLGLKKPVFVKLSPDLSKRNVDEILKISGKYRLTGFVISNLTKDHKFSKGGLSGKILENKANKLLKYVYGKTKGNYVLIGVGGIFDAKDAYKKIKLGANFVELISGMIFNGPHLIGKINYELVDLMKKDGYTKIEEAVGKGV